MVTFLSKSPFLMVPGMPQEIRRMIQGQIVVQTVTPNYEFHDHKLRTDDPAAIAELRNSPMRAAGLFCEEPPVNGAKSSASKAESGQKELEPVLGIKSKNAALAFLIQSHGAKPEELRDLKAADVKALAKSKYNTDFADWNP